MPPTYDRTANDGLLEVLDEGGWAHSLVNFAKSGGYALDLQLRGYANKSNEKWATIYVGLQKVLDLRYLEGKGFKLRAHSTLAQSANLWKPRWAATWQTGKRLSADWADVELYLERVIPKIAKPSIVEGAVQAAVCGFNKQDLLVIDREAALTYKDKSEKSQFTEKLQRPLLDAMHDLGTKGLLATVPQHLGGECDALAIGRDGRLLAIEIKPHTATRTIRLSPLQVRHYADLFAGWAKAAGECEAVRVINKMVDQRAGLGLTTDLKPRLETPIVVQPMVAVSRGFSDAAIDGLRAVQQRLVESTKNTPPLLVRKVTLWGQLIPVDI